MAAAVPTMAAEHSVLDAVSKTAQDAGDNVADTVPEDPAPKMQGDGKVAIYWGEESRW
ncbi:hypothetical protein [Streptomyces sp. NPDC057939]|uniref:hypothetical protein n=1 Tax=Streptomyces sp. NPDC057939 TaxID=3346284 RepID=UPI0036EE595A